MSRVKKLTLAVVGIFFILAFLFSTNAKADKVVDYTEHGIPVMESEVPNLAKLSVDRALKIDIKGIKKVKTNVLNVNTFKTTEVRRLLCMSDLFLLTSQNESFGLVALEAMAAKVPVISSNAGGIPEVNVHGVTGYLASPGSVEEMAAYGLSLLQDEEKLVQFKQQAFEHAKKFSIEKIVPLYEEAYEKALLAAR